MVDANRSQACPLRGSRLGAIPTAQFRRENPIALPGFDESVTRLLKSASMAKSNAQRQKEYKERRKQEMQAQGKLEEMKELGRRYGEDEANRRQEVGKKREERIARAIRYQEFLWERDSGQTTG